MRYYILANFDERLYWARFQAEVSFDYLTTLHEHKSFFYHIATWQMTIPLYLYYLHLNLLDSVYDLHAFLCIQPTYKAYNQLTF